jgi:plasmid stability protein
MATLTIKNIPEELYEQLKQRAAQNRRSINSEVIVCLERVLGTTKRDPEAVLANIRALRRSMSKVFVTDEDLQVAKNDGRL